MKATLDSTQTQLVVERVDFRPESAQSWSLRVLQRMSMPRSELFPFFADAGNLARITPPELGFHILTPQPIAMRVGTLIDYQIRLWGIPLAWRTEIVAWNPPIEFIDSQVGGPYAQWVHRHRFVELSDGCTLVEDHVRFELPFGRVGALAGPIVRRQLRRIFDYRRAVIAGLADDELADDD